ncbi:DinB family protein [Sphingobacterium sp. DK4209]|uniref:DinB family protein n=1 Tax=Sphingobacterium zhuxiongii TaxID=2662364 RepID=A0A5Q0Q985_9SPHI|nr:MULTISPECIES: DinB family protein [unclassified Sphingobacterium]MVZ66935.1 DinB family protein [Sphingobacterium sp. DK4209]QGA26647.1 DinB family protein [Sphingobacterium sp. dk4302]
MENKENLEVWMRGPIAGIADLLQPVAHALLQVNEDIPKLLNSDDEKYLWEKPFGMASPGFHILHIIGVIDRMFTYAASQSLTEAQFEYLDKENTPNQDYSIEDLIDKLEQRIEQAVEDLKLMNPTALLDERFIGRRMIPTTQMGLLFHAAEHAERHYGQLLVTIKTVRGLHQQGSSHT